MASSWHARSRERLGSSEPLRAREPDHRRPARTARARTSGSPRRSQYLRHSGDRFDQIYIERRQSSRNRAGVQGRRARCGSSRTSARSGAASTNRPDGGCPPADGSRVNAIIQPLALDGPAMSIRASALSPGAQDFVERYGRSRCSISSGESWPAPERDHFRRHGRRQDDALTSCQASFQRRAHRHHRGRGELMLRQRARRAPRNAAAEHRRQRRGASAAGDQRSAYAPGPHHRRRFEAKALHAAG